MNKSLKNNSEIAGSLLSSIQIGLDKKFIEDVNKINGSVQTYINDRVRVLLSEQNGLEHIYIPSGLKPMFVNTNWKPLRQEYIRQKRTNLHFVKTGHLSKHFPKALRKNKSSLIRTFGGYRAKTAKVKNLQKGRWGKSGVKSASWEFEIFNEVYKRKERAEILLDKFIPQQRRRVRQGGVFKTIGVPARVKFGLNMQGRPSRNYTRKFLFDYILMVERKLYLEIKEKFPVNIRGV